MNILTGKIIDIMIIAKKKSSLSGNSYRVILSKISGRDYKRRGKIRGKMRLSGLFIRFCIL